jgi:hypothetical protein
MSACLKCGMETPWESAGKLGIARAIFQTLRECLFSPFTFFGTLSFTHNPHTAMSFIYALVIGSAGSILGFFWTYLFLSNLTATAPWLAVFSGSASTTGASLIFMPLLITLKLILLSVYFQTLLFLTQTKRQSIVSTFSIVCYAESTAVFNCIPMIGSIVSFIWSLFLLAGGLSRVHRMSRTRVLAIILLPLPAVAILGILALALVMVAGALFSGFL